MPIIFVSFLIEGSIHKAMRTVILLAFLFQIKLSIAQNLDLQAIRKDFNQGVKDKTLCEKYHEQLKEKAKTPIEKGYYGAFHMFMAKHTANPIKKMNYFKNGKGTLEELIKANPKDVELRFIRLCIQFYTPKYLGYHQDVEEDKKFVMDNLYKLEDKDTKNLIYKYLAGAKMYTDTELALLAR